MAGLIQKKVNASTLIEVLVSMVIIMGVFAVAMGIYIKIMSSGFSLTHKQVQQQMQNIMQQSRENKDFSEGSVKLEDIEYHKKVRTFQSYTDLYLIEVEALQNGKILGTLKQVVRKDED
jgi:Tfp pilus assembly protein PilV